MKYEGGTQNRKNKGGEGSRLRMAHTLSHFSSPRDHRRRGIRTFRQDSNLRKSGFPQSESRLSHKVNSSGRLCIVTAVPRHRKRRFEKPGSSTSIVKTMRPRKGSTARANRPRRTTPQLGSLRATGLNRHDRPVPEIAVRQTSKTVHADLTRLGRPRLLSR